MNNRRDEDLLALSVATCMVPDLLLTMRHWNRLSCADGWEWYPSMPLRHRVSPNQRPPGEVLGHWVTRNAKGAHYAYSKLSMLELVFCCICAPSIPFSLMCRCQSQVSSPSTVRQRHCCAAALSRPLYGHSIPMQGGASNHPGSLLSLHEIRNGL